MMNTKLLLALSLSLFSRSADACDFRDVILGECPSESVRILGPQDSDRGSVSKKHLWTNLPAFKRPKKISLNVCFFSSDDPVQDTSAFKKILKFDDIGFDDFAKRVELVVQQWTNSEKTIRGRIYKSNLDFNFRDSQSFLRKCSKTKNNHIRLVLNRDGINRSDIGTNSLLSPESWSMALNVGSKNDIDEYSILHEFGHSLGFIHEMGHPKWKRCSEAIDYKKLWWSGMFGSGYSKSEELKLLKDNINEAADNYKVLANTKDFDKASIMSYVIPATAFKDGLGKHCAFEKKNSELSALDRSLLIEHYGSFSRRVDR